MTDFQTHQLSIDRSRPGIWTVSIGSPPMPPHLCLRPSIHLGLAVGSCLRY
jgi:hypothetical protein